MAKAHCTKLSTGFYRFSAGERGYSNIHHRNDGWHADIRNSDGSLRRYAGIWKTLTGAENEARSILEES